METQGSVTEWCEKYYPGETRQKMLQGLVEEVTELCVATGDISYEEIIAVVKQTWDSLSHDRGNQDYVASGIADIQIALYAIGSKSDLNVQNALNDKMRKNRVKIGP